MNLIMSL